MQFLSKKYKGSLKKSGFKLLITALFTFLFLPYVTAQTGTIKGAVQGGNDLLPNIPVILLRAADSTVTKFGATDSVGVFHFRDVPAGDYRIAVKALGWKPFRSTLVSVKERIDQQLLPFNLIEAEYSNLATVTVSAKKAVIEQKPGMTTINVDASPGNIGNSVMEVLVKSPGIFVDQNGAISLNGKRGILVMLDGKPSYLTGQEQESYLKGLSSLNVQKIEIMTTPPAKYDAAGGAGAINIITKKANSEGFNSTITANNSQGIYSRSSLGTNMNYYSGKFNVFLNGNVDYGTELLRIPGPQDFHDQHGIVQTLLDGTTRSKTRNTSPAFNLKTGIDYRINDATTIGMVLSINKNNTEKFGTSNINIQDFENGRDSSILQDNYFTRRFTSSAFNMNLAQKLDKRGGLLTIDFDYLRYTPIQTLAFNTRTFDSAQRLDNVLQQKGTLPFNVDIYSAKADLSKTIGNDFIFNAGLKSSYVANDNEASYFLMDTENNEWKPNPSMSRRFLYKENINAAYLMVKKAYGLFEIQGGLRAENTNYRGNLIGMSDGLLAKQDSTFSNAYLSLFPTLNISYKISKDNLLSLNYGRKVDRPNYYDLNPFLFYITPYTSLSGNADLKPQFTNNIELYYSYQSWLSTTLSYGSTKDAFENISYLSGQSTVIKPGNIGIVNNVSFSVNYRQAITRWWSSNLFLQTTYGKLKGNIKEQKIEVTSRQFSTNLNNQFNFSHGWTGEISGFYRGRTNYFQGIYSPVWTVNAALSKSFLNDRLTARVAVSDIFYSQQIGGTDYLPGSTSAYTFYTDSRRVAFSCSYKFGSKTGVAPKNNNANKTVQEAGRIK